MILCNFTEVVVIELKSNAMKQKLGFGVFIFDLQNANINGAQQPKQCFSDIKSTAEILSVMVIALTSAVIQITKF